MTVESVNYINDLDQSNPKGSDKIAEGDNHIRNIKGAITKTFPNVDGEVSVNQDELNQLAGLGDLVAPSLPEVPTEEGSMLVNEGAKWSENVTMKVLGDKLYIPALAGIGKLNLYVDENGEVLASEMATDPTMQHDLNFHTDVDFQGAPEEDDFLVHDGTAWRAKKSGGNTMQPFTQPTSCGDFSVNKSMEASWEAKRNSNGTVTLSVPDGMRFIFVNLSCSSGSIDTESISIDGVTIWPGVDWANVDAGQQMFGDLYQGKPNFVAKNSISMSVTTGGQFNEAIAILSGFFQEDD